MKRDNSRTMTGAMTGAMDEAMTESEGYGKEAMLEVGGNIVIIDSIAPLETLEAEASEQELKAIEGISAPSRRAERLAWRRALSRVAGRSVAIDYTPQGAPILTEQITIENSHYTHISVSHCRDKVAVMLSEYPCGIDIEQLTRDFSRISARYITSEERALCHSEEFEAIAWCAKEALYKLAQTEGLDFRRDIIIEAIDLEQGTIIGRAGGLSTITLKILRPSSEHIVVATI